MQIPPSLNACHLSALAGPLIAGFAVYLILSYLFVPHRIAIPLAIIISTLIFGLTKYYTVIKHSINDKSSKIVTSNDIELEQPLQQQETGKMFENDNYNLSGFSTLFFVVVYSACLLIVTTHFFFFSSSNEEIFIPWERFTIIEIIELGASISLCFFLPGYALLSVLYRDPDHKIGLLLKILLAYILSILITGLTGYTAVSVGIGLSDALGLFLVEYLTILIFLIIKLSLTYNLRENKTRYFFTNLTLKKRTFELVGHLIWRFLKQNNPEFIVFASLIALTVLSTYYLYSGAIIGDQWYHHGRILAFMSGEFRGIAIAGADNKAHSPFPGAMLASFISVSGIPSVNAFASISFLNIIPVFAFYYFFKSCVPNRVKKAALLGCTLFMLSSGFGWVFALELAIADPPESLLSALQMLSQAAIKSLDIILPTSFLSAAHPDFSTPLILMALPAGFTLLGVIGEKKNKQKSNLRYLAILLSAAFLGVLSHDEFYLFIIIASIVPIFYFLTADSVNKKNKNYGVVYRALLGALLLTLVLALFSFDGAGYYTYITILGIPLILLSLIFVTVMCILYITTRFFYNRFYQKLYENHKLYFKGFLSLPLIRSVYDRKLMTIAPRVVLVSIIAWLYVITLIVWSESSVEAVEVQTYDYKVPWYLYPVKLGVTGLLGIAFVLSYLFRRFEKEIFIFGIIAIVAFVTGPYYDEHRFSKYVMAGLAGFASLFIYSLIVSSPLMKRNNRFRTVATSLILGSVILTSALSIFIFWGYNASAHDSGSDKALGRRDFPSALEFSLFRLLRNDGRDPLAFNVAAPSNEYASHTGDLIGKIHAFSGIPWTKLTQSPLTLNASTLEGFYDLLHRGDTHYIVLPKEGFIKSITGPGKQGGAEIPDKIGPEINEEIDENRGENRGETGQRGQENAKLREEQRGIAEGEVLRFALENFKKAYEDEKYVVLAVPSLTPQQSQSDIGLIIPKEGLSPPSLSLDNNTIVLQYDNYSFAAEDIGELTRSGNLETATSSSILHGDKGEIATLWSNPLRQHQFQNANYIEAVFRILGENKTSNDAGIMWRDGNKEYTASVRNDRLEILVKPIDVGSSKETHENKLVNVRDIKRENGIWYTLKIITLEDYVNIYINDILAVKVPRESNEFNSKPYQQVESIASTARNRTSSVSYPPISDVGIFSFNNIAEFKPIEIGQVQMQPYEKDRANFEHYYPLNMLALSKSNYETFIEGDLSVFSKKIIVLDLASLKQLSSFMNATDSKLSVNHEVSSPYPENKTIDYYNNTENKLLEFVKKGGTLVISGIFNPDSMYFPNQTSIQNSELGELFSFQAGDEIKFDSIGQSIARDLSNKTKKLEAPQHQYLNISGAAQGIKIKNASLSSSDFKVTSYYMRDNNEVAPFALEKRFGAGKIIVINSGGYFSAITGSPRQYFQTLAEIPRLIDLTTELQDNNNKMFAGNASTPNAIPIARVVGDLKISGHSVINSTSLSVFANKTLAGDARPLDNDKFRAQGIVLSPSDNVSKGGNNSNIPNTKLSLQNNSYTISNAVIRDLTLVGEYKATITSNNSLVLPSTLASYYDYIAASIPTGSNINIKLRDGATAEFIAEKTQYEQSVRVSGNSTLNFYNISDLQDRKGLSVLLKSPEIKVVNGRTNFENLYMYDPYSKISSDGGRLDVNGSMILRFDHVDNYNEIDSNGGWINTQYLTYLNSVQFDKNNLYNSDKKQSVEFPADISELAKDEGVLVPWQKALLSPMAVITSLSIIVVAVTLIIFRRSSWLKQK